MASHTASNTRRPDGGAFDLNALATLPADVVLSQLGSSANGLSRREAKARLRTHGFNEPAPQRRRAVLTQLFAKFLNPLVIVLLIIGTLSFFFGEKISAALILMMILISVFLSFTQEYRSGEEARKLTEMIRAKANVLRDGVFRDVLMREVVPGDVVDLAAGDMIPADVRFLSCKDFFINQSALTGESLPAEKFAEAMPGGLHAVAGLNNIGFMGSSVVSGTARGVVLRTGEATHFGRIVHSLTMAPAETSFDRGISRFAWLMIRAMAALVVVIFAINFFMKGNALEALLFSLAVAVGLTPEMLPMLVTVNLSKGAVDMARKQVIVRHLNAIQNLGAMTILCTDKTGTLTLDRIVLEKHCDVTGREDEDVLRHGYINSFHQTGLRNVLDRAILRHERKFRIDGVRKIDEIPFDFSRRIMSVVVEWPGHRRLISKGAPEELLKRCSHYELDAQVRDIDRLDMENLRREVDSLSAQGYRVVAVAYRDVPAGRKVFTVEDERDLILKGYLAFLDPPKPTARTTLRQLNGLGVDFKVLTGDNDLVTRKICGEIGLDVKGLISGDAIDGLGDEELKASVRTANVFARMSPLQKERVIRALRRDGEVVGYLGDGINDAPALRAADVGISVDNAVDIAKESADLILLRKSLRVLVDGVLEGRRTFANIMKYIKMGSSSNFGNMIGMTGASLLLPFLPMTPLQILLNNFLYDLSQIGIATDAVDDEDLRRPSPWDIGAIRRFMFSFGPVSSLFDFVTFAVLLRWLHVSVGVFRTGWFVESLLTQTLVIYVIRTTRIPFVQSRPSRLLMISSAVVAAVGLTLPLSPLRGAFGFTEPPPAFFAALLAIVAGYLGLVQALKRATAGRRPPIMTPLIERFGGK